MKRRRIIDTGRIGNRIQLSSDRKKTARRREDEDEEEEEEKKKRGRDEVDEK